MESRMCVWKAQFHKLVENEENKEDLGFWRDYH